MMRLNSLKKIINTYRLMNYINPDTNSKTILLYKRSNNPQAQHKIDLIKLTDDVKYHYVYIKNCDKLMSGQTNKTNRKNIIVEPALMVLNQKNF